MPYQTTYGSREQSLAEAIADALAAKGVVGGSSGGGMTVATPTAITPTLYTIPLNTANTEVSQAIANAELIEIYCRSNAPIRYAFAAGKVATPTEPYRTIPAGASQPISLPSGNQFSGTLYLASSSANIVVELEVWS